MPSSNAGPLSERERTKNRNRFGWVLLLLIVTVFFSISAPDEPWPWLTITAVLAATLRLAMLASGVHSKFVLVWSVFAGVIISVSIFITITQEGAVSGYLASTSLLLTLVTICAIVRQFWLHAAEISGLTILGAVCIYVLLGLSFGFVFQAIGDFGAQPFFASPEDATRSDYMYFSFITMSTVGYGDFTPEGNLGRALAVIEGLLGQIYLVIAVAVLVSSLGRKRAARR